MGSTCQTIKEGLFKCYEMKQPILCISLDFEKFWGVHDLPNAANRMHEFSHVDDAVDRILDVFEKYEIRATWATVGLLNHDSVIDLKKELEKIDYPYNKQLLNPKCKKDLVISDNAKSLLAKDQIRKINNTNGQEIGSHTFSHFYCLEEGIKASHFEQDLSTFLENMDEPISSIVFPRNQVNQSCLLVCKQFGIQVYRGAQESWFWRTSSHEDESWFKKMYRTLDAYLPIYPSSITQHQSLTDSSGLMNIPGNRFLRPISNSSTRERLKMRRIRQGMRKAAKSNGIYHLWWHPHNFAHNIPGSMAQLESLLIYFKQLQNDFGMQSFNMRDFLNEK